MSKNCVVCKTNPAELFAKIQNQETGEFSAPVPLCEKCYNRISKNRIVETVPDPKITPPAAETTKTSTGPSVNSGETTAYTNFSKLGHFCDNIKHLSVWIAIICGILAPLLATTFESILIVIIGASIVVFSIFNIILFHMLTLFFNGIADYVKK